MKQNCATAVGPATAISTGSFLRAPTIGTLAWTSARASASTRASSPVSTIIVMPLQSPRARNARNASLRPALWRGAEFPFVVVLPVTLLLQSVGDVLRHIGLVGLREHAVGPKGPSRIEGV